MENKKENEFIVKNGKLYMELNSKYINDLRKRSRKKKNFLKSYIIILLILLFVISSICNYNQQNNLKKDLINDNKKIVELENKIENKNKEIEKIKKLYVNNEEFIYEENEEISRSLAGKRDEITVVNENIVLEDDIILLAKLIQAEADISNEKDMLYVGNVVINRMEDLNYEPDTIEEVIFAEGQYASTWNGRIDCVPSDICIDIAKRLLIDKERYLPSNVFYQAQFIQGSGIYEKVGVHYYCFK